MSYTFFNEVGVEPVGYVGLKYLTAEMPNAIHLMGSNALIPISKVIIEGSLHKLLSDTAIPRTAAEISDAIHKHFVYQKFNAVTTPVCDRYLHTPYESDYLDTEYEEYYLHSEYEEYFLNDNKKCE